MINTHKIILGDCIAGMKTMPDGCVQTCITSPPYFGLRDYQGGTEEIGQEETVEGYVEQMVEVFREIKRILRDDGTVWLNLGDSYMSAKGCSPPPQTFANGNADGQPKDFVPPNRRDQKGLKNKDMIGIPWRVAFALQADGWYLRQDIIWNKPNPMPESVTDRCTKSHEYIFLLSKKSHYYFDHEAIREPAAESSAARMLRGVSDTHKNVNGAPGQTAHSMNKPRPRQFGAKVQEGTKRGDVGNTFVDTGKRNKRSVWTVTTKPFRGAHFATFPKDLIEPCVLAGTSEHGCCSKCGAPWNRDVEIKRTFESGSGRSGNLPEGKNGSNLQGGGETKDIRRGPVCHSRTIGWEKTCKCVDAEVVPCTVFDPFTGSGTTAIVALKHNRNFIGTELNEDYIKIAEDRIRTEIPQTLEGVFENE